MRRSPSAVLGEQRQYDYRETSQGGGQVAWPGPTAPISIRLRSNHDELHRQGDGVWLLFDLER
jgi:hypothetical protein